MYTTYIRSIIEYYAAIWNQKKPSIIYQLERPLRNISRAMLRIPFHPHRMGYISYAGRCQRLNMKSTVTILKQLSAVSTITSLRSTFISNAKHVFLVLLGLVRQRTNFQMLYYQKSTHRIKTHLHLVIQVFFIYFLAQKLQ